MRNEHKRVAIASTVIMVAAVLGGMLIHFFLHPEKPKEYETLSEIEAYAQSLPEFPEPDDQDWLDPLYDSYNKKRAKRFVHLFLDRFGYQITPAWSVRHLMQLAKDVTKQNHDFELTDGKNNFLHIRAVKESSIYIFGDMHGAFHSLVRDLGYLSNNHIIDDNLKILDEHTYIVFNGDAVNRNAYNVDTLILILTLMKKNPRNVFYVAGNHERDGHWLDYGLRRELQTRGRYYSQQFIPAYDQLMNLFETLPEAIYVTGAKDDESALRIAFNVSNKLSFDEDDLNPLFFKQRERVTAYTHTKKTSHDQELDVRAAFKTEEWRQSNRIKHGLGLLNQDHGATMWAVLSSPIYVHKVYLDFYDDAFAELLVKDTVEKASVARVYNDIRTRNGFIKGEPLSVISAQPIHEHTETKAIGLASSMSLVRGVPTMGQQVQRGLNVMVNQYNASAVDHRHSIRLYISNDDYVPSQARANVLDFIEHGINFLILPIGTPTLMSYIDLLKDKDIALFFPVTGSSGLRKKDFTKMMHFRATYEDEVRAIIEILREEYGATKFAFFYQDDSYGQGPFKAAVEQLKKLGVHNFIPLPYTRGSISFESQINEIKKNQPDALGFFSTAVATQEMVRQMGVDTIANTQLFGISFVGELALRRFAKRYGLSLLFGAVVPNPKTSDIEIAKQYRDAMKSINSDFDVFSFEAYIATAIFLDAIDRLRDKPVTPKNVLQTMESIKSRNFHGLNLNFDPNTRSLATAVWLETNEDSEWKEYPIK